MRIPKAIFIEPGTNHWYGGIAVSLSVFVFAYSFRYGPPSILLYYALWLPLILIDYRAVLGNYIRYLWIIAFGVFACLSVFWSDAPSVSARAAIQYASHIVCALIAARTIDLKTFLVGLMGGTFLVLLFSFAFGDFIYDPLDGSYSFSGLFSSKNQLGFFASLAVYAAFAYLFMPSTRRALKALAVLVGAFGLYALVVSQSATAMIALAATLLAVSALGGTLFFSPGIRKTFVAFGLTLAIILAVGAYFLGAVDLVLAFFGKDSTLTGRTYLWEQGWLAAQESPIIGLGYQAYWVQGFSEAERLWEEFYITARGGFHFHNTYIEAVVELGYIGFALIILVLFRTSLGVLRPVITNQAGLGPLILTGIMIMLVIRSFFEIDVMHPYAIGSFLLYYCGGRVAGWQAMAARPARSVADWAYAANSRTRP
jgi:exopolysaccharide production protein ExoQ